MIVFQLPYKIKFIAKSGYLSILFYTQIIFYFFCNVKQTYMGKNSRPTVKLYSDLLQAQKKEIDRYGFSSNTILTVSASVVTTHSATWFLAMKVVFWEYSSPIPAATLAFCEPINRLDNATLYSSYISCGKRLRFPRGTSQLIYQMCLSSSVVDFILDLPENDGFAGIYNGRGVVTPASVTAGITHISCVCVVSPEEGMFTSSRVSGEEEKQSNNKRTNRRNKPRNKTLRYSLSSV